MMLVIRQMSIEFYGESGKTPLNEPNQITGGIWGFFNWWLTRSAEPGLRLVAPDEDYQIGGHPMKGTRYLSFILRVYIYGKL